MSKKHEMTEREYEVYRKSHDYDDPLAVEQGKIDREKANYARISRKSKADVRRRLRELEHTEVEQQEALDLSEGELKAARELGNARTHKQRLKGLRKHVAGSEGCAEGGA